MTGRDQMSEETKEVAFQGEPGAYSEAAAIAYFGEEIQTLPCYSFEDIFDSVVDGKVTHGLIPIENSLAGSIHRNYDLMLRYNLNIVGEYHLRVSHCLMAFPGVKLAAIRTVHSHPQALAQCDQHIADLGLEIVVESDTAGSARMLKEKKMRNAAAIASKRAADVYNLQILLENMEDNTANYTRFLAITQPASDQKVDEQSAYKSSIVFSLKNQPGSLYKAMGVFASRDIDLTKIESRPIAGKPWEYMFYIDFAGHAASEDCNAALDELKDLSLFFRLLGAYPRHQLEY